MENSRRQGGAQQWGGVLLKEIFGWIMEHEEHDRSRGRKYGWLYMKVKQRVGDGCWPMVGSAKLARKSWLAGRGAGKGVRLGCPVAILFASVFNSLFPSRVDPLQPHGIIAYRPLKDKLKRSADEATVV
jgi:hypothetical protein